MSDFIKKYRIYEGLPDLTAKIILEKYPKYTNEIRTLHVSKDNTFWLFEGGVYEEYDEKKLKWDIERFIEEECFVIDKKAKKDEEICQKDFAIDDTRINKIIAQMRVRCHQGIKHSPLERTSWLFSSEEKETSGLTSFENGTLDGKIFLNTGNPFESFSPHNPRFYNCAKLPIILDPVDCGNLDEKYQPCVKPVKIIEFLKDIFQEDEDGDSVQTFREFAGNTLFEDKKFEKALWLRGLPRSGKGTAIGLLQCLHGRRIPGSKKIPKGEPTFVAQTAMGLLDRFGLQDFPGKRLFVLNEPRIEEMTLQDRSHMMQKLLQIISQDLITIHRKGLSSLLNVLLPCKVIVQTNNFPAFKDKTGAIFTRFIHLTTRKNWLGNENPHLLEELCEELPRFVWWILTGYRNLISRGRYKQPEEAYAQLKEFRNFEGESKDFIDEMCITGNLERVRKSDLYDAYVEWCKEKGATPLADNAFSRDLNNVCENAIKSTTNYPKEWKGIGLKRKIEEPKQYKED